MTIDYMAVWRDMPLKTFFTIDGEVFQKNSATTALHVTNPMFGELYISPIQARAIKPYVPPTPDAPAPVAPKDPEVFETKAVERRKPDPNFGATDIMVTPVDITTEQAIQPPAGTGKRQSTTTPAAGTEQPPVQPPADSGGISSTTDSTPGLTLPAKLSKRQKKAKKISKPIEES